MKTQFKRDEFKEVEAEVAALDKTLLKLRDKLETAMSGRMETQASRQEYLVKGGEPDNDAFAQ